MGRGGVWAWAASGRKPKAQRVNYVGKGLDSERTGGKPDPASTKPYGCTVKY